MEACTSLTEAHWCFACTGADTVYLCMSKKILKVCRRAGIYSGSDLHIRGPVTLQVDPWASYVWPGLCPVELGPRTGRGPCLSNGTLCSLSATLRRGPPGCKLEDWLGETKVRGGLRPKGSQMSFLGDLILRSDEEMSRPGSFFPPAGNRSSRLSRCRQAAYHQTHLLRYHFSFQSVHVSYLN